MTSEIVILHTTLDAIVAGLEVTVLLDACGGLSPRTEQAAFRQIEAAGGRIAGVASFASDLVRDFTTPTGRQVIAALHGLMQQPAAEPARQRPAQATTEFLRTVVIFVCRCAVGARPRCSAPTASPRHHAVK